MAPANRRRKEDSFEYEGWLGKFKAAGSSVVPVVVAIALAGALAFMVYDHDKRTSEQQTKLSEHMDEMIYVISLPESERAKLNVNMPDSLRRKTRL